VQSQVRKQLAYTEKHSKGNMYVLIIKVKEMHYLSNLFGKELYMFRTDLPSIIRSLDTVFTAVGICHTGYVDCLLARSGWGSDYCAYSVKTPDDGQ